MVTTPWVCSLLGPGEMIMGTGEGKVPLSLSRPAIALLCFTFHLLVLVSGTRLVLFLGFRLVRILTLVLAIRMFMSDGSRLLV